MGWDRMVANAGQITDTERLDWLQAQTTGYGAGWMARSSSTGRGFRLHETERAEAKPTVREAIDEAMAADKARGK